MLVSRSQLARTMRPSLSWRTDNSKSNQIKRSVRTVRIYNSGGGRALIVQVKYRISTHGSQNANESSWISWEEAIYQIKQQGLRYHKDFYVLMLGAGAALRGSDHTGVELAAFTKKAYSKLLRVEALIQFDDVVGDTYERAVRLLSPNDEFPRSRRKE